MDAHGAAPAGDAFFRTLSALSLGAARLVPVTWLVSPFGGAHLPAPFRVALAFLLAGLSVPALLAGSARAGLDRAGPGLFIVHLGREALVGLSMGLVVACAFRAAEAAGRLADTLRGASLAEVLSPVTGERASPLGALYLLLSCLVFFELGGLPRLLQALVQSYDAVPLGGGLGAHGLAEAAGVVGAASARLIEAALALAAPVIVTLLLTDLALGLMARAVPAIPVYFLGLPLKALLGVGIVLIVVGSLAGAHGPMARDFLGWLTFLGQAIAAWQR